MGFPHPGPEGTAIARTQFRDNAGATFLSDNCGAIPAVVIDDQDFAGVIEATIDRGQITLCLPDGKGDVLFFVQTRHEDSEIYHNNYLIFLADALWNNSAPMKTSAITLAICALYVKKL